MQFSLLEEIYGAKALERMHLRAPAFVRFLGSNPYPRITVTHRPSQREADWAYGPFPSRAAAERYAEEAAQAVSAAPLHLRIWTPTQAIPAAFTPR